MSEEWRERLKASWREIVMARTDSEVLGTKSEEEVLSLSGKSSVQRWRVRAERILRILADREQQYGSAAEVYAKLAGIWSARLGVEVTVGMVMIMLMDMKTVREPSQDTLDDVVGYAMLYGDVV